MTAKEGTQLAVLEQLRVMSLKLDKLNWLEDIKDQFIQMQADVNELKCHIMEESTHVTLSDNYKTVADFMIEERNQRRIEEEALKFRKINWKQWAMIKNRRKLAYYYELKFGETAQIYKKFFDKEVQFIPKKFLSNNTSLDEARVKMDNEITDLEAKKVIQTSVKEEANKKMERLINNASTSELARHKLYEIWLEERLTEEKTSQAIWGKKKGFLEQLEEKEKADKLEKEKQPKPQQQKQQRKNGYNHNQRQEEHSTHNSQNNGGMSQQSSTQQS